MSLSWSKEKDGIPIAITNSKIAGLNDRILFLHSDKSLGVARNKKKLDADLHDVEKAVYKSNVKQKPRVVEKIYQALYDGVTVDEFTDKDEEVEELYEKICSKHSENKSVELEDATFNLLPTIPPLKDGNFRQTIFLAAMSGSGKSWWVKEYVLLYHEAYPKNKIFFVSQGDCKDDPSLKSVAGIMTQLDEKKIMGLKDNQKIKRNKIVTKKPKSSEPLAAEGSDSDNDELGWQDFPDDCLVILDDYDGFKQPIKRVVQEILDDLLSLGRKRKISLIASSHNLNKSHCTDMLMKETQFFVLFPKGIPLYNLNYFCTRYLGFSKEKVKKIKRSDSRWIVIKPQVPSFELTQFSAQILEI